VFIAAKQTVLPPGQLAYLTEIHLEKYFNAQLPEMIHYFGHSIAPQPLDGPKSVGYKQMAHLIT
jgi:hypothetical protein